MFMLVFLNSFIMSFFLWAYICKCGPFGLVFCLCGGVSCCVRDLVFIMEITLSGNRGSYLLCEMYFIVSYPFFLSMLFRG